MSNRLISVMLAAAVVLAAGALVAQQPTTKADKKARPGAAETNGKPALEKPRAGDAAVPETPAKIATAPEKVGTDFDRYDALITAVTVFVLAVFVGFEVISKVPTTLHTPLMSGSNAISGIAVVGAIIVGGFSLYKFSSFLGFLAIVLATINVVGGFYVTHRMLSMFRRK